jgi:hypothetical protein
MNERSYALQRIIDLLHDGKDWRDDVGGADFIEAVSGIVEPFVKRRRAGPARRFIIEGEWTGYQASQQRVVHRTVHHGRERDLRAWADRTHAITYTDGTRLLLTVRDANPGERVTEIHGYDDLIRDCARENVTSVEALRS